MKIIILSDSHDNIVRLKHVLGFASTLGAGAIIHCGDWNTPLAVNQFAGVKIPVFGVLGNADVDPTMLGEMQKSKIKVQKDFLEIELGGRKILVCHYPPLPREASAKWGSSLKEFDVFFHGHTHQKRNEKVGKTRIVNPGALHRTLEPTFAVYETELDEVEFVSVAL